MVFADMKTPRHGCRALCLSLLLALGAGACSETRQATALPEGATVLALGDSITHGTGAARGEDFPTRLAAASGWQVINAGVPGDTTAGALARLPDLLEQNRPELVIVEIGGNDFLRKRPDDAVADNLSAIIGLIRERDLPVALVAVPRLSVLRATVGALDDAPIYADLASTPGVYLIPDLLSDILSDEALRADPVHPNAAGYAELAEGLQDALRRHGFIP